MNQILTEKPRGIEQIVLDSGQTLDDVVDAIKGAWKTGRLSIRWLGDEGVEFSLKKEEKPTISVEQYSQIKAELESERLAEIERRKTEE